MSAMIISASRRTDIPAFYGDWLAARLRAGFVDVRNPFNARQIRRVSLAPADITALVLWTRDGGRFLPHLPLLDTLGLAYWVHYTITAYPRRLERAVPDTARAVCGLKAMADHIGPDRVLWRYDPILLSADSSADDHRRRFAVLARDLAGHVGRVTISFADFYRKTARNLASQPDLAARLATADERRTLAADLAAIAASVGLPLVSCAEAPDLAEAGVTAGKCVDDALLAKVFGITVPATKDKGQRPECGCVKSVDIGAYDTCPHGCLYCYANASPAKAARARAGHQADALML